MLTTAQARLAEQLGVTEQHKLLDGEWWMAKFDAEMSMDEALATAQSSPAVEYAEPNYILQLSSIAMKAVRKKDRGQQALASPPNDPGFGNQWALQNTGQFGGTAGSDVGALPAWPISVSRRVVVVALLDTGIDVTHPDLQSRIWVNAREVPGNALDDDHNGFVDDVHGWNFVGGNNEPLDDHYHGTLVSGAIAAETDNGLGVAGVAGRAEVRLMPLKLFDAQGQGTTAAAAEAITYATRNGAHIINISWGDTAYSQALFEALQRSVAAGCLVVAAAGNQGANNDRVPVYPASFNSGAHALPAVISVAGTDDGDRLLDSSNFGAQGVDLAAPGQIVYSTLPGGNYGYLNGTSIAAALVSGIAALVWAQNPALSNVQVKQILMTSVRPVATLQGKTISGGIAHAHQALLATPAYAAINTAVPVSAADYISTSVAPDSIVAVFGAELAARAEIARSLPLPTSLAGSVIRVNGMVAPLFAVSPGQINFLLPAGLPNGPAEVKVVSGSGSISTGIVNLVPVRPGIFTADQSGSGAPAGLWTADGLSYVPVGRADGTPIPIEAGGYLVLSCTGLRHAADGNNGNGVAETVQISIGGTAAPVLYAGAQGDYAGLDQVNLQVPASLRGRGRMEVVMRVAGQAANKVVISVR